MLEDLTYVDELHGERTVALRFKARVEDRELEGIDFEEMAARLGVEGAAPSI